MEYPVFDIHAVITWSDKFSKTPIIIFGRQV
jgi:hypothetical protein